MYAIKRLEEVVLFTVGLMADPTPLVDHVYQAYIKRIPEFLRRSTFRLTDTDDEEERLQSLGKSIYGMRIFQSLYKESAIKLPASAFHNQHLNFYLECDTESIYLPSTLFMFDRTKTMQHATIRSSSEELVKNKTPDSVIISSGSDDTDGLLNTIQTISKLQPIRHLFIRDVNCEQFEKADVFHMSNKCENILLWDCVLPSLTLDHLFQQISSCSTLQTIDVRDTNLGHMESLSLQNLPSLTKLGLWKVNLCRFHLLHLAYLVENRKLPNLKLLDIGGNSLNHLLDELEIFLQVVAKNHQTDITVVIYFDDLPNTFWQEVRQYTEPPSFLHISGGSPARVGTNDIEEQEKEISPTVDFLRETLHTSYSLLNVSFADCLMPRHLYGPILQVLSLHGSIRSLDLSGNILGIYGHHLVNTVRTWGPVPSLQELDLSHCSLPVKVCGPLLSALGRCRSLTELWLPGNTLTGCLHNFLADHDSRLPSLKELFLSYTKLNVHDLQHLNQLIQNEKMPQLGELDLGANNLNTMEEPLCELVQALVSHHQRELKLNLYFNHLSYRFVRRMTLLCQNTDIELEFG